MQNAKTKMLELLEDLKSNYFVSNLKLEFEAEGTRFEEALFLKDLTESAKLNLTVKIGGCEAVRDILDSHTLMAKTIVAPMIETPYALSKFVKSVNSTNLKNTKLYINIETITGIQNLTNIIESDDFSNIKGIVLGRSDLAGSLHLQKSEVNSDTIFEMATHISEKIKLTNKDFIVGGNITPQALPFLEKLPYLTGFETRKIVFDKKALTDKKNAIEGINKAIEFEIEWLKFKQKTFGLINNDIERLKNFEQRLITKNEG